MEIMLIQDGCVEVEIRRRMVNDEHVAGSYVLSISEVRSEDFNSLILALAKSLEVLRRVDSEVDVGTDTEALRKSILPRWLKLEER